MDHPDGLLTRPRRGWADKRQAITAAAVRVFGREGYTRASIDAIASEASVSTRTIYNHFGDKEHLFLAVIQESATQVADAQIELIRRHLDTIIDLEQGLTEFGLVWATSTSEFADHFALVRQIHAEVGHIPTATLKSWQELGPRRVHQELARLMQHLADRGLLALDDADRAASHLVLLTSTEVVNRSYHGAIPLPDDEVTDIVTAGIRTFLHGYLPPTP
ncbi:MAG: TetR/AcrR family transcriptional regulator [Actinomycetota bacterium]|nr:TetR/AcrR family transcriptional regulator [Actinomycetota bacterium]